MGPTAELLHQLPGRARLRVDSKRGDAAYFAELERQIGACPAVSAVSANPLTATLLLRHVGEFELVGRHIKEQGILAIEAQRVVSLHKRAASNLEQVDRNLRLVAGEGVDLNSVLLVGLSGFAIHQALNGNLLAPAATLAWYALALMRGGDIQT